MSVVGQLRLGFVALTDAAPLLVADARGFFADEGLSVELSREVSWATVRDQLAAGLIDGAHMLAPMALAARLGVGGLQADFVAPIALNVHGAAIVLAQAISGVAENGWVALAAARRNGGRPLTFGVVFPFSTHAYLMRDWLAEQGLDPDRDVRLVVAAPTAMVTRLGEGALDGFCVGAPWHALAESTGLGRVVRHAGAHDPAGPDKVFAVRERWADRNSEALSALLRALTRAGTWADDPTHLDELVALLAAPERLDAPAALIAAGLTPSDPARIRFATDDLAQPKRADALRLLDDMRRWGQLEPLELAVDPQAAAAKVYRPDLLAASRR